ncbi:hypothetical protein OE88DRAFT_1730160 [Heliocybe sulcata]|uniref:RRM domain-containing protein n=1 Tax=Heliocybe sulcata TaxID=5364 RepID=A0A5C3NIF0_9AGAM|nr:hypothetical protein OE88DRAFT_1730160 [Heliocybe sulcata]
MPHKQTAKPRAWGTRFDSLDSSPPPSPPSQDVRNDPGSQVLESPIRKMENRMPHDASVFVGSLPTHVEHQELTRLLSEHLSQHAEVKSIKVVRDSKGGVCAFVQCEDATAAARLIYNLQTTPCEPFMGRTLRFEPARAFRTLLISFRFVPLIVTAVVMLPGLLYMEQGTADSSSADDVFRRAPIQPVPSGADDDLSAGRAYQESPGVQLDLPVAVRLWRPQGAKYVSVLYNDEACQFDTQTARNSMMGHDSGTNDAFSGSGVFLCPMKFDKEAILNIACAFGRVDQFSPYSPPTDRFDVSDSNYPYPHDAPRASSMDTGCWQVKWGHRDDCVNALMTLRRVPFLTVTWAHQPNSSAPEGQQLFGSPTMYHSPRLPAPGLFLAGATYPLHVRLNHYSPRMPVIERQDYQRLNPNEYQRHGDLSGYGYAGPGRGRLRTITESSGGTVLSSPLSRHPVISGLAGAESSDIAFLGGDGARKIDWSESEFPPLGEHALSPAANDSHEVQKSQTRDGCSGHLPPTPLGSRHPLPRVLEDHETSPRRDASSDTDTSVPPTPDFVTSPVTPRTPGFKELRTPISHGSTLGGIAYEDSQFGASFEVNKIQGDSEGTQAKDAFGRPREVDPTTIFVGGLEMFGPSAWDEERVRSVFEKFGGVEDVRVVKPFNKRSAFAFVRFNNTEAPARAVAEEHNRIYEGRQIRVQLRDNNSHRSPNTFKYGRGGRVKGYQYGPRPGFGSNSMLGLEFGKGRFDELRRDEALGGGPVNVPSHVVDRHASAAPIAPVELQFPSISCSTSDTTFSEAASVDSSTQAERPPAVSPPPSSVGSSVSAAGPVTPYPVAPMGYYPGPWMSGFAQPWPYPVPYMTGFSAPPLSGAQTPRSYPGTPGSSDASGSATQPPWVGMYRPFVPCTPYPMQHEATQAQFPAGQPPLRPTGFVQNEHGMLVPVYQPEALGQYMTSSRDSSTSLTASTSSDGQPVVPSWPQPTQPVMCPQPGVLLPVSGVHAQGPVPAAGQPMVPSHWPTQASVAWPLSQPQHSVIPFRDSSVPAAPQGVYPIRGSEPLTAHPTHAGFFQQHAAYNPGNHKRQPRRGNHFGNGRNHSRRSSPDRFTGGAGVPNYVCEHPRPVLNHSDLMHPEVGVTQATGQMNGEWSQ